jgi:hypothetical protein
LQPKKLRERAARIAKEAKGFHEDVSTLGPGYEQRILEAKRQAVIDGISCVVESIKIQVDKQYQIMADLPSLYQNGIVVVYAAPYEKTFLFSADRMRNPEAFPYVASQMRKRGTIDLQIEVFKRLINELRAEILAGKLDERLHLSPEELIFNKMRASSPY